MTLSINGVLLSPPEADVVDWCERTISVRDLYLWERTYWPGADLSFLAFPGILTDAVEASRLYLGRLRWPRGAARWASLHLLVSNAQLTLLRGGGSSALPTLSLIMSWEDATTGATVSSIAPPMQALPPLPLAKIGGANGYNLLTLVDARFFWWAKSSGVIIVSDSPGGSTTWDDLLTQIGTALGVTLTWDAIPGVYLNPPRDFAASYEYLPLLLDAVLYSVGQRLVANLDGSFRGRNFANGLTDIAGSLALASARSLIAGGPVSTTDSSAVTSATLLVAFPSSAGGLFTASGPTGGTRTDTKTLHDGALYDGTNAAQLTALAVQMAADYGAQFRGGGTWKYAGIVPWQPDPIDDAVEWTYRLIAGPLAEGEVSTRVYPPSWNDLTTGGLHSGSAGSDDGKAKCCQCKEFDFIVSGLSPGCEGNGGWRLKLDHCCCLWCGPGPGGGQACLTLKPGDVGSLAVLEICTAADPSCCAVYRGVVSDCKNFTINADCCAVSDGWPATLTILCECAPGTCTACTTESGAPFDFTLHIPAASFASPPLSSFNDTDWTLLNTGPCVWSACQTIDDLHLCVAITIRGADNSTLFLTVGDPANPDASASFLDSVDPDGGDCCSRDFIFALTSCSGGVCCTCANYQFFFDLPVTDPCRALSLVWNMGPAAETCSWDAAETGIGSAVLTQNPGGTPEWTLSVVGFVGGAPCTVIYTGQGQGCGPLVLTQPSPTNPNFPLTRTVTCTSGPSPAGGGSCPATLTAHPECCEIDTVVTPCCPGNRIRKQLTFTVQPTGICPNLAGVSGILTWHKAGTGPCPAFPFGEPGGRDYWRGTATTNSGVPIIVMLTCLTVDGVPRWGIFALCQADTTICFNDVSVYHLADAVDCSLPVFVFTLGSLVSCCGAGGGGTITVT